ncbi:MAG: hypothetical protein ACTSQY_11520 [Candidatus Odinarchaeia archaeon]
MEDSVKDNKKLKLIVKMLYLETIISGIALALYFYGILTDSIVIYYLIIGFTAIVILSLFSIKMKNRGKKRNTNSLINNSTKKINQLSYIFTQKNPYKAVKISHSILIKIIEAIKQYGTILNDKFKHSIIRLVNLWESRITRAISDDKLDLETARRYVQFVILLNEAVSEELAKSTFSKI